MSNVGRPRTGLKECPYCDSTSRDSNGQCHCRNTLYRLVAKAPQQKTKIVKAFNAALTEGENAEGAANVVRAKIPATGKVRQPKKQATKKASKKGPKDLTDLVNAPLKEKKAGPTEKARYILKVDGWEETPYARKDAAIKNGVRSGLPWIVEYKGKILVTSEV